MQKLNQLSVEDTYLLPVIKSARPRAQRTNIFQVAFAFSGAAIILFVYFVIPLAQLFTFIGDWIAQMLCAFIILTLIEGSIGLVLLSIAKSVELDYKKHLKSSDYSIERVSTVLLPAISLPGGGHVADRNSTEHLPALSGGHIALESTTLIPGISKTPILQQTMDKSVKRGSYA